jgi:NAD+ diphosphatase
MFSPRNIFKFCPQCGADHLSSLSQFVLKCRKCGFQYHINSAAAAVAIIKNEEGELLTVRRARMPKKGKLHLPGGFVEVGETAEEALVREVREELNIEINTYYYLRSQPGHYTYKGVTYYPLELFFECTVKSFENIILDDENSEYIFIPFNKLDISQIGFDTTKTVLSWYKDRELTKKLKTTIGTGT